MKFYSNTSVIEASNSIPGQVLQKTNPPATVIEYMEKAHIAPETVLSYKLSTVESRGLLALAFGRAGEKKTTVSFTTLENGTKTEYTMTVKDTKPAV